MVCIKYCTIPYRISNMTPVTSVLTPIFTADLAICIFSFPSSLTRSHSLFPNHTIDAGVEIPEGGLLGFETAMAEGAAKRRGDTLTFGGRQYPVGAVLDALKKRRGKCGVADVRIRGSPCWWEHPQDKELLHASHERTRERGDQGPLRPVRTAGPSDGLLLVVSYKTPGTRLSTTRMSTQQFVSLSRGSHT